MKQEHYDKTKDIFIFWGTIIAYLRYPLASPLCAGRCARGHAMGGLSFRDQVISELGAVEAPSRPLFSLLLIVVYALMIAFGIGVWKVAAGKRRLQVVGGLLAGLGVMALTVGQFVPMHMRGTEHGLTGTLHLVEGGVAMLMIFTAMGIAATVFGTRFRLYTIATIVLALAFGAWSGMEAPRIEQGVATPWAGVKERIFWYGYQSWFIVLAIMLLRSGVHNLMVRHGNKQPGKTPPFRGPHGGIVPGSITEITYLRLSGIDQWVMIRGESITNPVLILLHGGPGLSETGLFRYFNAELEKSFTVVYWDQRGAGKSFDPTIPKSSMTVEQFIADLDELVDAVHKRLGKNKVTIFGHSWGAALGVLYAARFPHKVAAYVGSGQIGDWQAAESASYAYTLAEAKHRNNQKAVKELLAIGPPPYSAESLWIERTWLQRLEGQLSFRALWNLGRVILSAKESSIFELPGTFRPFRWTLDVMWDEVSKINLLKLVLELQMPVFFFLGRKDHWVPAETSVAYFNTLRAPSKKLVWFEESGHEPFMDEPAKFNAAMIELVRPRVTKRNV